MKKLRTIFCLFIAMMMITGSIALGEADVKGDYQDVYEGISKLFGDPFSFNGSSLLSRETFSGVLGGNLGELDGIILSTVQSKIVILLNPMEIQDSGWLWYATTTDENFKKEMRLIADYATGYGLSENNSCIYYAPHKTMLYVYSNGGDNSRQENAFHASSVNSLIAAIITDVHPELKKWGEEEFGLSYDELTAIEIEDSPEEDASDNIEETADPEAVQTEAPEDSKELETDTDEPFEELSKGSKGDAVVSLQNRLNELAYNVGKADGDFGNKTKKAVEAFQKNNRLEITGKVDRETHSIMFSEDAINAGGEKESGVTELVQFNPTLMKSVVDQIDSAVDFTITENNRAILAALLSLEFKTQRPDFEFDFSLPIYVCKLDDMASVALGGKENYALVSFKKKPLYTEYGILYGNDAEHVKYALDGTYDSVWTVDLDLFNEKLDGLVGQL